MPAQLKTDIAGVTIQSPRKKILAPTRNNPAVEKVPRKSLGIVMANKIFIPRKFNCPHFMACVDLVAAHRTCPVMDAMSKSPLSATHSKSVS